MIMVTPEDEKVCKEIEIGFYHIALAQIPIVVGILRL